MAPPTHYAQRSDGAHPAHFRDITLDRIEMLESQLSSVLYSYSSDEGVSMEVWHAGPYPNKPSFAEATGYCAEEVCFVLHMLSAPRELAADKFGPSWTNHWVRLTVRVPKEHRNSKDRVTLEFDPSCEALIFSNEGLPLQGLTGGFDANRRVDFTLDEKAQNSPTTFYIEVTCNEMFGNQTGKSPQDHDRYFTLNRAEIVVHRKEGWGLLWDYQVTRDLARTLPENSLLAKKALNVGNELCNIFVQGEPSTIAPARKEAERLLGKGWRERGASVYKDDNTSKGEQCDVWAISNCHIDTAWLWPFTCTQQKIARSWSSQVDLMNRYPEHRFACSQAQQFKWLEQLYPQLFDVIKGKIEDGPFQPIGGTWVEMDTNMPSGEAICRQFAYGQRYFKSRFGKYCETFWLPVRYLKTVGKPCPESAQDTFGYSSQLPQLCRLAGMKYFFTQKLSWSQFNDFPHSTFNWVGIDGSQVITHMTPVDTYTAQANVGDVNKAMANHKSLEYDSKSLLPFGNGDGGGGATAPMLEHLRRIRAAANEWRDIAKPSMGKSVDEFFHAIERDTQAGSKLASWQGELYLELHRGTYTSHGSIKRHNRKSEQLMRDLEYFATAASMQARRPDGVDSAKGYRYPKDEIDELWEDVLLCQFHDVLPGSAIGLVYEDAERIYAKVAEKGLALLEQALKALHPDSEPVGDMFDSATEELFLADSMPERKHVGRLITLPKSKGGPVIQSTPCQKQQYKVWGSEGKPGKVATATPRDGSFVLSNSRLQATVSSKGRLTSLYDLEKKRELILPGRSAGFVIYEDLPHNWDAWDVDIYHLEKAEHLEGKVEIHEVGPLRASLRIVTKFGKSTVETIVSIDAQDDVPGADPYSLLVFENQVNWHERHRFLKFEAPVDIRSDYATYETQFGVINRPTHRNTTWDRAKFEVCGHRFADLSEYGYGVALINDCKYGYAVDGQVMRLSLLRGSTEPDAEQDQGHHVFDFALYPHASHFMASNVPFVARAFNLPPTLRKRPKIASARPIDDIPNFLKSWAGGNVFVEALKRSDDDDFGDDHFTASASTIVRFAEVYGGHAHLSVTLGHEYDTASLVDILEREVETVELDDQRFTFDFKPFEVKTLKLTKKGSGGEDSDWVSLDSADEL